jgi:PAS domain S-box-containing protein
MINKKNNLIFFLAVMFFVSAWVFPSFIIFLGLGLFVPAVFRWGFKGAVSVTVLVFSACLLFSQNKDIFGFNFIFFLVVYSIIAVIVIQLKNIRIKESINQKVVEKVNDLIIIVQDETIKYVNQKVKEILGYSPQEIIETDFREYVDSKEISKLLQFHKKRTNNDQAPSKYKTTLKHKSGGPVYVEVNVDLINYQDKPASLVIAKDITQEKQVEDILSQREQEFNLLVENAPDVIARFDDEFRCVYVNPAVEKEFNISPKNFFWKNLKEVGFPQKTINVWEEALNYVFQNNKEKTIYFEHQALSGLKYYQSRLMPESIKKKKTRTVLSITRDITEAEEIDRIKSEFISISSHQLRTPLSIVRWCASALLEESTGKINKEQKEHINSIYSASKKMIKLTNAFLNVAILDLGVLNVSPVVTDFSEIAERALKELDFFIKEKEIKIVKKYQEKMPEVKADQRLLEIVFVGLISNAIKYSYPKQEITVEIKTDKDNVLVGIADQGYGIEKKDQDKIFKKFFRADNVKEEETYGTGLDLYIIKSIIKNCEGEIWFQSPNPEAGKNIKGTVFFFSLPRKGTIKRVKESQFNG